MKKSMYPLISVIMPTYNHGIYIFEAIQSVLLQTYENLELIIVDNFSKDDTEEIVASFLSDKRIKYYKFNNQGIIASARNYGVKQARGELLAFLDSDDIWEKNKLEKQLKYFDDTVIAVASNYTLTGAEELGTYHLEKYFKSKEYYDFSYEEIVLSSPVMTSSLMMEKNTFKDLGGFNESKIFCFIEDWELWLRLSLEGSIRVINYPLLKYRVVSTKSRDTSTVILNTLNIMILHNRYGYLKGKLFRKARGNCFVNIGLAYLNSKSFLSFKYLLKGLISSKGLYNRKRVFCGLVLLMFPISIRKKSTSLLVKLRYYCNKKMVNKLKK
jgi:glycosyltransferase involved in cell wall biosynthesis